MLVECGAEAMPKMEVLVNLLPAFEGRGRNGHSPACFVSLLHETKHAKSCTGSKA